MTSLPTRELGRSGMGITRVGFGAWAIGGEWAFGWGPQDDSDSIAAIRHAVESGVNWIDTAPAYGLGHSEEVVADALDDFAEEDRPYVFTKAGLVWDEGAVAADRMGTRPSRRGAAESLRREVEASLRRLRVERLDLWQMHWPGQDGVPIEDYWGTFAEMRREGKVRAIGLSNHDVALLEAAEAIDHVDSLQPPFSLVNRGAASDVIPWCAAHETGVIVYSPMQSGLLSGSWSAERTATLDAGDWRTGNPMFKGDELQAALRLVEQLRPIADRHAAGVGAVAIAWTLAFPGVSGAIVGARTPAQIDGWIDAASMELGTEDLDQIAAAIATSGLSDGPERP